jgi:hypothetical protein
MVADHQGVGDQSGVTTTPTHQVWSVWSFYRSKDEPAACNEADGIVCMGPKLQQNRQAGCQEHAANFSPVAERKGPQHCALWGEHTQQRLVLLASLWSARVPDGFRTSV